MWKNKRMKGNGEKMVEWSLGERKKRWDHKVEEQKDIKQNERRGAGGGGGGDHE